MAWPAVSPSPGTTLNTPAGLGGKLRHSNGAERSQFGGLEHDAVAGRESRAEFPRRHLRREIPWNHAAHNADRLAQDQREILRAGRRNMVVEFVGCLGMPANAIDGIGDVHGRAIADGLASFERVEQCEFVGVGFQPIGKLEQDLLAVARFQARPHAALKRLACRFHRPIHIGCLTSRDLCQRLPGGGILGGESLFALSSDEFAVNERLGAELEFRCRLFHFGVFEFHVFVWLCLFH